MAQGILRCHRRGNRAHSSAAVDECAVRAVHTLSFHSNKTFTNWWNVELPEDYRDLERFGSERARELMAKDRGRSLAHVVLGMARTLAHATYEGADTSPPPAMHRGVSVPPAARLCHERHEAVMRGFLQTIAANLMSA